MVAGADGGEAGVDGDAIELAADVELGAVVAWSVQIWTLGWSRRERPGQLAGQVDPRPPVVEGQELGALDDAVGLDRPGDRAAQAHHPAGVDHRGVAAEGVRQRAVLPATDLRIALGRLQPPEHLGAHVRVTAGDHDAGRRATAMAIGDARGGDDVVIEVGVERGEGEEVVIGAAPEGRDVGFAQRLADVHVLARDAVLTGGALDQVLQLVGAEQVGMAQAPITAVGPGQLDLALVATVEVAAEQMLHVAQHLPGIRLDDRMDVVAHDRARAAGLDRAGIRTRPERGLRPAPVAAAARGWPAAGLSPRRALPDLGRLDRAGIGQLGRPIDPLHQLEKGLVVDPVAVLHRLGSGAGDHGDLARVARALTLEVGVQLADRVAHVDRGAGQLGETAEELLAVDREHEAALEALIGAWGRPLQRRVDHPLGGLALAEAQPARGDVGEVRDEGRPADLDVAGLALGEPFVGLGVELDVGLDRARSTDVEHRRSPWSGSEVRSRTRPCRWRG